MEWNWMFKWIFLDQKNFAEFFFANRLRSFLWGLISCSCWCIVA